MIYRKLDLSDLLDPRHEIWNEAPTYRWVEVNGIARGATEALSKKEEYKGYSGNYGFYRAWLQKSESQVLVPIFGFVSLYGKSRNPFGGEDRKFEFEKVLSAFRASSESGEKVHVWALLHDSLPPSKIPDLQVIALQFGGHRMGNTDFNEETLRYQSLAIK